MSERRIGRRGFWRAFLGSAVRAGEAAQHASSGRRDLARDRASARDGPAEALPVLRPPGAIVADAFLATCQEGCRMCVETCPVFAIVPSYDAEQPGGGDGRPYLLPDRQACVLCGLCMLACPTGALQPTPADDVRIGRAVIIYNDCLRVEDKACDICIERCPSTPLAIHDGERVPTIVLEHCTGCGLCAEACPPHAIAVVPRP